MKKPARHINSGLHHVGIGVYDLEATATWYRKMLGFTRTVYEVTEESAGLGELTQGEIRRQKRRLLFNPYGGAGVQLIQFVGRDPRPPEHELELGDLGISAVRIKVSDVERNYARFQKSGETLVTRIVEDYGGWRSFFLRDNEGRLLQLVEAEDWFRRPSKARNGGVCGALISASSNDDGRILFEDHLEYGSAVYNEVGVFGDLLDLPGGEKQFRRLQLKQSFARAGRFADFFGPARFELLQEEGSVHRHTRSGQLWGDPGFVCLAFEMAPLEAAAEFFVQRDYDLAALPQELTERRSPARFAVVRNADRLAIKFLHTDRLPLLRGRLSLPLAANNVWRRTPHRLIRWAV